MKILSILSRKGLQDPEPPPATPAGQAEQPRLLAPTPAVKTGELFQGLSDLAPRLGMLASSFNASAPLGGFAPVFAALLGWIAGLWTTFQQQGCKALTDAYQAFREAAHFNAATINTQFGHELEAARTAFLESVRASAQSLATRSRERWEALAHAQSQLPVIKRDLWLHLVKMTGSDSSIVEPVDYERNRKQARVWFYGVLAIEIALGMFAFESRSNRLFAIAAAFASAIGIMFARDIASEAKALINGWEDAVNNYNANYPGQRDINGNWTTLPGCLDFEGNVIQLYPLSTTIRQNWFKAEVTYWMVSLGLLAWRVYVSATDPAAGLMGVVGAVMVIVISGVFGWVRKYPAYQRHLQDKWQELVNDQRSAETDIVEFSKPDPDDPFQGEVSVAKSGYFTACSNARLEVHDDLETRRQTAKTLLGLHAQYEQALNHTRSAYQTLWPQAAGVCTGNPDANFFANPANVSEADTMFASYVRPTLSDPNLLVEARSFDPQVTLTFAPLTSAELDTLAAEEETRARNTNSLTGGPVQGMLIRRN